MKSKLALFAALTLIASSAPAADKAKKQAPTVSGGWTLTVQGPAAHGDMAARLDLKQEAKKVSGTFALNGKNQPLAGEFSDGALSLQTTDTPPENALSFNAQLKEDGTLSGHVSTPMGDMKFSAKRAKDNK
jgi:opacity protein-like surface antigen